MINRIKLLLLFSLLPSAAFANVGIPLLAHLSFVQILYLIPVIFVEALVFRELLKMKFFPALFATTMSNIASTIIGFLVTFPTFVISQDMYTWRTKTALIIIIFLYPFYRLSIWSEHLVLKTTIKNPSLHSTVVISNRLSYCMLLIYLLALIVKSYLINGKFV